MAKHGHTERIDHGRNRRYCECGKPWPCREGRRELAEEDGGE